MLGAVGLFTDLGNEGFDLIKGEGADVLFNWHGAKVGQPADLSFAIMSSKELVLTKLRAAQPELRERFPIRSMALFGSVSRGDDNAESDVDVLVEFHGPVGMGFLRLARELAQLLGRKVDLVSRGGIKPRYYQAILPELEHV